MEREREVWVEREGDREMAGPAPAAGTRMCVCVIYVCLCVWTDR